MEKDQDLKKLTKVFKFVRDTLKKPRVLIWIGFLSNIHLCSLFGLYAIWLLLNQEPLKFFLVTSHDIPTVTLSL